MQFKRVALDGRAGVPGVEETLSALVTSLQTVGVDLVCAQSASDLIHNTDIPRIDEDHLSEHTDLLVVVGGDGSLLNSAHYAVNQDLPVVGINRGRLGFLTDICPTNLEQLKSIIHGEFTLEQRFMIESYIKHDGKSSTPQLALNDVVLLPGDMAQMIAFDVFVNDQLVYEHRADGLIIATPTGSTAYALSGGGPILQPQLPALALVPMFPHTLSSRPIVINANNTIRIKISPNQKTRPHLSNDGRERQDIPAGGEVIVTLYHKRLQLIHPKNYNYYTTLREKLNWEQSARRKND